MSIPEFHCSFGSESIKAALWPQGFRGPRCAGSDHYVVGHGARMLFQCNGCRHQTPLTAGTIMEHAKLPVTTWFLTSNFISQGKTGLSALVLKRPLGVSYTMAWLRHRKINRVVVTQDVPHQLSCTVQRDDAYLGGERAGGKVGQDAENKVPFAAAVSVNDQGHLMYVKLKVVGRFTSEAISKCAQVSAAPGTCVHSDDLGCFIAVMSAGCIHVPMVDRRLKPRNLPGLKWAQHRLNNLKITLARACHSLKHRKYAEQYHACFSCSFSRRYHLRGLVASLIVDVVRSKHIKEKAVRKHAEARF